eukprot:SM000080S22932  [mRNA]  locus=s80:226582:234777:+ [translate_table: standard]
MAALTSADVASVYALLAAALSQAEDERRPAEAALAACEARPGFCSCLLEVIAAKDAAEVQGGARWLAAVYFKNSINRFWRTRRDTPGIGDDEKAHLRAKLLEQLREENNQVAAASVATVAATTMVVAAVARPQLLARGLPTQSTGNAALPVKLALVWHGPSRGQWRSVLSRGGALMQVAVQLALLISKIARFDYPREWPGLFPALVQKVQLEDVLLTQRAYLVLNHVLKELSTKRLAADQRNFAEITAQLFEYTWHHWCGDTQVLLQHFATANGTLQEELRTGGGATAALGQECSFALRCERWLLCLKVLRRMLHFGFPSDAKSVQLTGGKELVQEVPAVQRVVPAFLQCTQTILQSWVRLQQPFLERACLKLAKTVTDIQAVHPYSFSNAAVLPPVLQFVLEQVTAAAASTTPVPERFLIQCMIFLQAVLKCLAYKQPKAGRVVKMPNAASATLSATGAAEVVEEAQWRLAEQAQKLMRSVLDDAAVVLLCNVLVQRKALKVNKVGRAGRYFVLTAKDLEEWGADAEAFHHEQDMAQWRDRLRPCAEALYLTLFENHREVLAPIVMGLLATADAACPPPSGSPETEIFLSAALLAKDAAYLAMGIANYDLYDYLDFRAWYERSLAVELANRHANGRILRRRVAWLLGQWVSKVKGDLRRPVYGALVGILGEGDLAVQLAACHSLRNLIDDVHFYEEEFSEFVEPSLHRLFRFMREATQFDSQLQIFNLVSLIIERLGDKIVPCAEHIMAFLPQVWQESEGQSLLRIQVMLALQRLIGALGNQCTITYPLLFPILHHSTDITLPDELNLLEDGMQLWLVTLRNAPTMVPQILSLFSHLVPVMERNFDHLQVAMKITESYILLGGADFLHHHAAGVVSILELVIGNVKEKGSLVTLPVVDVLILCFPAEAPPALESVLQKLLYISVEGQPESDIVIAAAVAVLTRVLLQNPAYFVQLLSKPSTTELLKNQLAAQSTSSTPLLLFLESWLDKIDSMSQPAKRKLSALALCIILSFKNTEILDRLDQILGACMSMLNQSEGDKDGQHVSYDYWPTGLLEDESPESEFARRRQVSAADPVHTLSLKPLLKEKLQECSSVHGESRFREAMSRLHPSLLAQLQLVML